MHKKKKKKQQEKKKHVFFFRPSVGRIVCREKLFPLCWEKTVRPRAQFFLIQTSRPVNNIRVSKSNITFMNPSLIMCNNWKLFFKSSFNNRRRHNHPFITRTTAATITITITVFLVATTTTTNFGSSSSFFVSSVYFGGRMAECLGRCTCNVVVPGSSPPPCYSLDSFLVVLSSTPWLRFCK